MLLHKRPAIGCEMEIFEWKANNWIKLLKELNMKVK